MINVVETVVGSFFDDTLTFLAPANARANDVLVAALFLVEDGVGIDTVPTGWTLISTLGDPPNNMSMWLYYLVVGSDALPSSAAFVLDDAPVGAMEGGIMVLRGADVLDVIGAESIAASALGATHSAPDITMELYNSLLVSVFGVGQSGGWASVTAGMAERFDISGANLGLACYTSQPDATGATGVRVANPSGDNDEALVASVEIRALAPPTSIAVPPGPGTLPGGRGIV